jgi:hypothetical protein
MILPGRSSVGRIIKVWQNIRDAGWREMLDLMDDIMMA